MPELDELLDDELDEEELDEEEELEELLDDELLVDEVLLDELDELLPVGAPEDVVPPPQPTRSKQPASMPPVTLSNLLMLYICCNLKLLIIDLLSMPSGFPPDDFSHQHCAVRIANGFLFTRLRLTIAALCSLPRYLCHQNHIAQAR